MHQRTESGPDAPDGVTVGEAARRAGITVRTLHHWDHIGLARPSGRTDSGYRLYSETDQNRIHRVVAYQRAGLGLEAIRDLLDLPADQIGPALTQQRQLLAQQIGELQDLDAHLQRIEAAHDQGILLSDDEQAAVFGGDWDPSHAALARQQWGSTPQWAQFAERSASRSTHEWAVLTEQMRRLEQQFAVALDDHVAPDSARARELVDDHRALFSEFFPITRQMQVCLGRLFANDPGFASHYDRIRPGLATWLHHAINQSAAAHGINPAHATWQ